MATEQRCPEGFVRITRGDATIWLREDLRGALGALDFDALDARIETHGDGATGPSGRGQVQILELPGEPDRPAPMRVVLRRYLRGGLLSVFVHDRFLDGGRALREIELFLEARRRGLPTLDPLAAVTWSCAGGSYRHGLLTRLETGVQDLAAFLASRPEPARRDRVLVGAAEVVREMHRVGLDHADLNLKNLLIRESDSGRPEVLVIDLDGGRFTDGPLPEAPRLANLQRFVRSSVKFRIRNPECLDLRAGWRLARAYFGADKAGRDAFRERLRDWLDSSLRVRWTRFKTRLGKSPR